MTYTPLINDSLVRQGKSDCCAAPCYFTNGHERRDPPGTTSTWWNVCGECGEPCSVIGNPIIDQITALRPAEQTQEAGE